MAPLHASGPSRNAEGRLPRQVWRCPPWLELSESPPVLEVDPEPNQPKVGWQRQAVEQAFIQNEAWPTLDDSARALMRSQHGPLASAPFTVLPASRVMRIEGQSFRLLLCRRLRFPLHLSLRTCRCGRQLDSFGHHGAACQVAGVLGRRGFPLECAAAQVCREAGARVTTNMLVRDMDLGHFDALDARRLEVVADGLTLWRSLPSTPPSYRR